MHIPADILKRAMELYIKAAYPAGVPAGVTQLAGRVRALEGEMELNGSGAGVWGGFLTKDPDAATRGYALRLGQPRYPHMKLVVEPLPEDAACGAGPGKMDFVLRVDVHDRHLHAPAGSPDEAWLMGVRMSNKELAERIEGAWAAAGLPTFKVFLREQVAKRKGSSNKIATNEPGAA